jgi:hypothetical protein
VIEASKAPMGYDEAAGNARVSARAGTDHAYLYDFP